MSATALAHPNIAVVKYWGKRDLSLNLPAVPSLSVTLDTFQTVTEVSWGIDGPTDEVELNGWPARPSDLTKISRFLDLFDGQRPRCRVVSANNFPTAAGLASSSSAFAALALAAASAAGHSLDSAALSRLARRGSGSATRSLWGGWVEWPMGEAADGSDCHGKPLAPAEHWDLRVVVAIIGAGPKAVGSTAGMNRTERTSPLYPCWVSSAAADVEAGRAAILDRDLDGLGEIMEHSTYKMHATMLSARPPIRYWEPATIAAQKVVEEVRQSGIRAWATMDAGPNVKVLCRSTDAETVATALRLVADDVLVLGIGGDARLL